MNKEFIPYKEALALKELGFDEECFAFYEANATGSVYMLYTKDLEEHLEEADYECYAPLYQQAFRWFREKYGLFGWIEGNEGKRIYMYRIESPIDSDDQLNCFPFKTYEEAELACLRKLIEIVNQNKDE